MKLPKILRFKPKFKPMCPSCGRRLVWLTVPEHYYCFKCSTWFKKDDILGMVT